jgi:ATP-dependent DNA ligase
LYVVFDLLELDGEDRRVQPLRERREALGQLVAERQLIIPARQLPANGLEAWDECCGSRSSGLRVKASLGRSSAFAMTSKSTPER